MILSEKYNILIKNNRVEILSTSSWLNAFVHHLRKLTFKVKQEVPHKHSRGDHEGATESQVSCQSL